MLDSTAIIHTIDCVFTNLIVVPMIFILYAKFTPAKKRGKTFQNLYRLSLVLVAIFLIRCFCAQFIFTKVNYQRFTDSGLFPLIKALFYPDCI